MDKQPWRPDGSDERWSQVTSQGNPQVARDEDDDDDDGPLCMSRMWHKVKFWVDFHKFKFCVFLLFDRPSYQI